MVNSEIVYQCKESEFSPSSNTSLCGEDGMWSPDPSRVECMMIITATAGSIGVPVALTIILSIFRFSESNTSLEHNNLLDPTYLQYYNDGFFMCIGHIGM